jgi:hypothetical protein
MLKKIQKNSERGQAIILIVFAIVGLVAIVGLMTDGGILLIEYARLKRGIDSASIAAAAQFRKNFDADDIKTAGEEFLQFNQSTSEVTIFICDDDGSLGTVATKGVDDPATAPSGAWHDPDLCPTPGEPARKLVRIEAKRHVDFGFMRVVGMNGTDIVASSVGEAASIDMVLLIDTSSSMAYETTAGGDPDRSDPASGANAGDDPEACNNDASRRCEPLGRVKDVAVAFVNELFFPYDRVALVSSNEQTLGGFRRPVQVPAGVSFMDVQSDVEDAIRSLKVFTPGHCPLATGPCLRYEPEYKGQTCGPLTVGDRNPTSCGASNIGGALTLAGDQFADARQDSFWAVIALIGGPANAAVLPDDPPDQGFCPGSAGIPTWWWNADPPYVAGPAGFCRDRDSDSRHHRTIDNSTTPPHYNYPADYDADDYARDAADYIASPTTGQNATIFSICMGGFCQHYPSPDPASAENLGKYMAYNAGDSTIPLVTANHGIYRYAEDTTILAQVFDEIAKNIFTRISQ